MYDNLKQYTDDQLLELITQAHKILDERDHDRRKQAAKQIRLLAAEVGLAVEIKGTRKRRSRPRKTATQSKQSNSHEPA